jgi:hypothetical protein
MDNKTRRSNAGIMIAVYGSIADKQLGDPMGAHAHGFLNANSVHH